jgi:hypothetical protein
VSDIIQKLGCWELVTHLPIPFALHTLPHNNLHGCLWTTFKNFFFKINLFLIHALLSFPRISNETTHKFEPLWNLHEFNSICVQLLTNYIHSKCFFQWQVFVCQPTTHPLIRTNLFTWNVLQTSHYPLVLEWIKFHCHPNLWMKGPPIRWKKNKKSNIKWPCALSKCVSKIFHP